MSGAVNESKEGQAVRLQGYIVPLEVAPDGKVTEFFLAAYMGACIHVLPPPSNQMVYVKVSATQGVGSMYDACAVTGALHTRSKVVGLGDSAYTIDVMSMDSDCQSLVRRQCIAATWSNTPGNCRYSQLCDVIDDVLDVRSLLS